jgi:uncharacterized protein (DUF58 family)
MHQCHRNLLGTEIDSATLPPAFARTIGSLQLTLASPAPVARHRIEAALEEHPPGMADIPAGTRRRVDLPVSAPSRGIIHFDRVKITSAHPFGLFRAWTWVHVPLQMLVYPRPHGALPMPTASGSHAGKLAASGFGADEWLGLRPFRDGDSPRQVDWKAYAREAPLLVKEYSSSGSQLRMFSIDQLPALQIEARLEQMARWIVDAEARGDRYGIVLPAARIAPDRGAEHRHRCLAALALFGLPANGA